MSTKNTEIIDLDIKLADLILNEAFSIKKFKRLKIGCAPDTDKLQEIMLIKSILCRRPCYLSQADINKVEERLIRISNG